MNVIGVIPARFAASRFPGKLLVSLCGKPLIQHVWERARRSRCLREVIIASDDERIRTCAAAFGARVVLTSAHHPSGSDRIIEAVTSLPADIVINIQGDEPLIEPAAIDALAEALLADPSCAMATLIRRGQDRREFESPHVVKVVTDQNGDALYFSRAMIPFPRDGQTEVFYFKHLGLYGYRWEFLMKYKDLPVSSLECTEKLEQLRVLQAGYKIKTVETPYDTMGVDTPEDLSRVEKIMKDRGLS